MNTFTKFITILLITCCANSMSAQFITTWQTDNPGTSSNTSITIPTTGIGYNYDVDWDNDGIFDEIGLTGSVTHDFGATGTYSITIRGDFPRIYFNNGGDKQKILAVEQWGNNIWTSMDRAFRGCSNLVNNATDSPDLSLVTSTAYMFGNLKKYPELKIIALTNFDDISFTKRMLKNGAHGYLLKNTDKIEIIEALKTVLSGEMYIQKEMRRKLLNQTNKKTNDNGLKPNLTRREQDVLQAISEELTTQEISEKLFISPKTVETHRMNLMSKLGAKNSVGIIKIAIEKELLSS